MVSRLARTLSHPTLDVFGTGPYHSIHRLCKRFLRGVRTCEAFGFIQSKLKRPPGRQNIREPANELKTILNLHARAGPVSSNTTGVRKSQ